jgi:hypothetical protein
LANSASLSPAGFGGGPIFTGVRLNFQGTSGA